MHTNVYKTVGETKITSNSPCFVHIAFIHWRLQNSFHSKLLTYTPVSENKKVLKIKTKHIYLYMYLIYTFFFNCVCVFFFSTCNLMFISREPFYYLCKASQNVVMYLICCSNDFSFFKPATHRPFNIIYIIILIWWKQIHNKYGNMITNTLLYLKFRW